MLGPGRRQTCDRPCLLPLPTSCGTVRIWDGKVGKRLALLTGHKGLVQSVAFSPDGGRLLTGGLDETLRLWDPIQGLLLRSESGHQGSLVQATFSPDGKLIANDDVHVSPEIAEF